MRSKTAGAIYLIHRYPPDSLKAREIKIYQKNANDIFQKEGKMNICSATQWLCFTASLHNTSLSHTLNSVYYLGRRYLMSIMNIANSDNASCLAIMSLYITSLTWISSKLIRREAKRF